MKSLSRQQVFEAASQATNLTLKYDGTTKSLGHMVEVEIATKDGPLLMGKTHQVGGTASEYVRSITKTISRIEQTYVGSAEQLSILNKVSNTMTDRCVTNTAVDDQLDELKGSRLNRFRCAMHPLDAIEKACEKVVPCSATQNTLTKEMKSLLRRQVFEAATNLTLKYDGTTKTLGHMGQSHETVITGGVVTQMCILFTLLLYFIHNKFKVLLAPHS